MQDNSQEIINFPEEYTRRKLNSLYREIPLKDTTSRLLRKYFSAMTHLYGIITLKKAKEIFFEQNPNLVTDEEFIAFAEIARHENEDYYIMSEDELFTDRECGDILDRVIFDRILADDLKDYISLREAQGSKPYYIPAKKEFVKYADPMYCADTPEKLKLVDFLTDRLHLDEQLTNSIIVLVKEADISNIYKELNDTFEFFNIEITKKQLEELIPIYHDFLNNSRTTYNRGFTPNEMSAKCPRNDIASTELKLGKNIQSEIKNNNISADELRRQIIETDMPDHMRFKMLKELSEIAPIAKEQKVGRNELCPCGSGKKYKKCCGR